MKNLIPINIYPGIVSDDRRKAETQARYIVTVCATMDHRAYDAGEAFPFIEHLSRYVKNPGLIYEWKPGNDV